MSDRPHLEVRDPESGATEVAVLHAGDPPAPVAWLEYDPTRGQVRWHVQGRGDGDGMIRAPQLEYVTALARGDQEVIAQIVEVTTRVKRLASKQAAKLEKSRDRSDRMTSKQLRNDLRSDGLKLTHE